MSDENRGYVRAVQSEVYRAGVSGTKPAVPVDAGALERAARKAVSADAFAYLAGAFAERIRWEGGNDPAGQVERAFGLALGRRPSPQEAETSTAFLSGQPLKEFALAMFNLNAFLYIE